MIQTSNPSGYSIDYTCDATESDAATSQHKITIKIEPVTAISGPQKKEFEVFVNLYSYQGTFEITSPQYYILSGSALDFQHSEIVATDCQADYSATFSDTLGNYPADDSLANIALLDYDGGTQTITV